MKTITSYLSARSGRNGRSGGYAAAGRERASFDVQEEDIENQFSDMKVGCQQRQKDLVSAAASPPPPPLVCLAPEVLSTILGLLSAREVLKLEMLILKA